MRIEDYLSSLNITQEGIYNDDSYIIDLSNSDAYGRMFTKLDSSEDLELLDKNQVITEEGSSLIYESKSYPLILNLISDWESDRYQLIVNEIN